MPLAPATLVAWPERRALPAESTLTEVQLMNSSAVLPLWGVFREVQSREVAGLRTISLRRDPEMPLSGGGALHFDREQIGDRWINSLMG
jgi:hypothetical protein